MFRFVAPLSPVGAIGTRITALSKLHLCRTCAELTLGFRPGVGALTNPRRVDHRKQHPLAARMTGNTSAAQRSLAFPDAFDADIGSRGSTAVARQNRRAVSAQQPDSSGVNLDLALPACCAIIALMRTGGQAVPSRTRKRPIAKAPIYPGMAVPAAIPEYNRRQQPSPVGGPLWQRY